MTETTGSNKREFSRSHTRVETTVRQGAAHVRGALRDVSMNGVFVTCATAGMKASAPCEVHVMLSSEVQVTMTGHVVRTDPSGLAIAVEEIPVESFAHLQQLVLYNADDPDVVEREMREHIGIKRNTSMPPGTTSG